MLCTRSNRGGWCVFAVSAGLVLVSMLSGCLPSAKPSTPTLQPVVETRPPSQTHAQPIVETRLPSQTQTQPVAFPLSGKWTGSAKNGTFEMQVTIVIQASCQVGDVCGTFDLSIPCSGTFTLVGREDDLYEFRAGDKTGSCGVAGRDFLQLLPDGTLHYASRGDYGETLGTLVTNSPSPSPMAQRIPVIYDDDGSPDGTSALLYLLIHPAVELKAVGISYGEAHPAIYIQHIGRMLDEFGSTDIPLGVGQDGPLSGSNGFPEWLRESAGNFWGWTIPNAGRTYPVQDSADLIVSIIRQSPEPVTLFFSGPFTNLARALRLAPEIRGNIAALYMMGGAVHIPGNIHDFYPESENTYAEWNIYSDPVAAKEVFESGLEMYLVPLDATNQVLISKQDTGQWRAGGRMADFAADIYDWLMNATGEHSFSIWDLMAAEIMLDPDLCGFRELRLEVVTAEGSTSGQTEVIPAGTPNINVCLEPDAALIQQTLIDDFSSSR
jgi:pyrimidine-specific ribonucleoside hydrolase